MTEAQGQKAGESGARVRPAKDVVARRLGGEVVLVNLRTSLIYELNWTGARLWELLADGCDRAELERRMLREFDVEEETLRDEIDVLLSSLLSSGLVTANDGT